MESIIAIRKIDTRAADKCFADLMRKTEQRMNLLARQDVEKYRSLSPKRLEIESCSVIKEVCENTPFNPENVELVSGFKFPDIIADDFYGVEVKSTNKDNWTSTGSSIVESTRVENVENIYMLFGKLGGKPAEFKCRPYQDVLYDIAVTHSPRYLINMQLESGETIFDKIHIPYDELRNSSNAIEKVKKYYKRIAEEKRGQMPWWIASESVETEPISMNIRLWSTLSYVEQDDLRVQMMILFPEVVNSEYANAAMWLVSAKGIVNHCIRDNFTAGGKIDYIGGKKYSVGLPKVWQTISSNIEKIKAMLVNGTPILPYIKEYNPSLLVHPDKMFEEWMIQIEQYIKPQEIDGEVFTIKRVLEERLLM